MKCKNCYHDIIEHSDYCHHCGARVIRNRLTFRNLFEHISETFFNYDNKLLRTFIDLFRKPEDVIGGYIDGIRKRYVNPISYFGLALTLTGMYMLVVTKFYPETMDYSMFVMEGQEEFQARNMSFIQEYNSVLMMFYAPLYALMAVITFIGLSKYNYTEMIVVFTYIQAQSSVVTVVLGILTAILGWSQATIGIVIIILTILYSAYCLKRLYQLSVGQIIFRTFFFLVILFVFFVIMSIIMAVLMYLNGDIEQIIEAQKATREAAQ